MGLDRIEYVMHRHEERVARSLAVLSARGARTRWGWAARVALFARRSGVLFSRRVALVR
jgi:hypothetical protein